MLIQQESHVLDPLFSQNPSGQASKHWPIVLGYKKYGLSHFKQLPLDCELHVTQLYGETLLAQQGLQVYVTVSSQNPSGQASKHFLLWRKYPDSQDKQSLDVPPSQE